METMCVYIYIHILFSVQGPVFRGLGGTNSPFFDQL